MSTQDDPIAHYFLVTYPKIFDKYVDLYNQEDSKINATANLISIYNHFKNQKTNYRKEIDENSGFIVRLIQKNLPELISKTEASETSLNHFFRKIFANDFGVDSIELKKSIIDDKISSLNMNFEDSYTKVRLNGKIKRALQDWKYLQIALSDIRAINRIIEIAVDRNYPNKIEYFENIPQEEKDEISRAGRPLNPDVPQDEVIFFVKNILFSNDELVDDKKLVHSKGPYKGKPNWNQLANRYLFINPEIEDLITKRALITRLKEAYEEIISSLN